MPSSTDGDDMPFYHPQWNEHDKPTVRCPHVEGRRIGDDYCQHVCPHLTRVIDRQYETIIDCGYTVRRSHTPDAGGCRLQTTIATPAESAPAPREQAAEAEAKELQTLFDIQHTRTVAADDAWRNAHPERGSVIPDLGELINWLQARAEKAEAKLQMAQLEIDARKQECQTVTHKRDKIEAEAKALREALEQVALPGVGLANIFEDHPEETIDKYYAAYKYCMRDIERRMTIARAALDGSAKEEI